MHLRPYQQSDSAAICGWIGDETSLYQWSADRIGKFPLAPQDLHEHYAPMLGDPHFLPLTMVDAQETPVGHLLIRYPDASDTATVRFGFIILDPALRGKGNGIRMLRLAIEYAKQLGASRITLGVFANNPRARKCYESAGFRAVGDTEQYEMPVGVWDCLEMELSLK